MNAFLSDLKLGIKDIFVFVAFCSIVLSGKFSDSGNKIIYSTNTDIVSKEEKTKGEENLSSVNCTERNLSCILIFEIRLPNKWPATAPNPATPLSIAKFFPFFSF